MIVFTEAGKDTIIEFKKDTVTYLMRLGQSVLRVRRNFWFHLTPFKLCEISLTLCIRQLCTTKHILPSTI